MAGYLTTYGATALLNGTAMPTTLYAGLHTGDPGVDAVNNSGSETRRLTVTLGTALAGEVENVGTSSITLAVATETITYLSLWDALVDGNPWWVVPLGTSLGVTVGHTIQLSEAILSLTFELWS